MDQIPVNLLYSFVIFGEACNMTEAAAGLRITQPALSKQLRQLEEMLPQPLFTTSGRKKVMTPFGKDLHTQLKEKLGNIQQLVEQTWSLHTEAKNTGVTIAGRRGVLDRFSGKLDFPGAVFFKELSNEDVIQAVIRRECQLGIVHSFPSHYEIIAKPLFKEEFHLVIPKKLLPEQIYPMPELLLKLRTLPCLGYRPQDELIKAACSLSDFEMKTLKMVRATENYQSLSEMIAAGRGWAVMPSYLKISESKNWIVPISGKTLPSRQFFLVFRKEFTAVPWFKDLNREIRNCFSS